jgi:excisionase family DNA binding protein
MKLLTPKELAEKWAISDSTLRNFIKRGALKPIRIGRQLRFDPAEIAEIEKKK